ncbi:MAG: preprotein translocase subunit SecG [Acidimicrobiia bacterium]|nr:preprotein translocase subunit SecG [Acidimicrobiia bacterium]
MLESLLLAIHMVFSIGLIVLVLLHSAKGGGMSDMFGGGMGPMSQVPVMERNLDRLTVAVAILFGITTMWLTIIR